MRTRERDFQGVEAPWHIALARESTRKQDQGLYDARIRRRTQGGQGRGTEARRDLLQVKPQGLTGNWVQVEGGKGGSAMPQET